MGKIYIGGAISHLTFKEAFKRLNGIKLDIIKKGNVKAKHSLQVVDSIDHSTVITTSGHDECGLVTDTSVFNRCRNDIRWADTIIFNLLGVDKVSIGSVFELSLAYELGKNIIVIMEDENLHNHLFIKQAASYITDNVDDAVDVAVRLSI